MRGSSVSPTAEDSESRLVEYRTSTCLCPYCAKAEATGPNSASTTTASGNQPTNDWRQQRVRITPSPVELGRDLEEPRRQNGQRLQPGATWNERVVVGQHRAGVEDVVDIKRNQRSRPSVFQRPGQSQVELIDAIAVHRAR